MFPRRIMKSTIGRRLLSCRVMSPVVGMLTVYQHYRYNISLEDGITSVTTSNSDRKCKRINEHSLTLGSSRM